MREAAARIDYDYADDPPRGRQRARHIEPTIAPRPPARARSQRGGVIRAMVRRPMLSLAIISGLALSAGFVANALFMQSGPHPAPLLASKDAPRSEAASPQRQGQTQTAPVSHPAPVAAPRSAPPAMAPAPVGSTAGGSTAGGSLPAGPVPSTAMPAPPQPPQPQRSQPARAVEPEQKFDPITQFLRSGSAPPAAPLAPTTTASTPDPGPRRIVAAQRALAKLGHKVEADGLSGPSTRAAIQAFEREARLPVTGELNPRTMRELASRSGLQIP